MNNRVAEELLKLGLSNRKIADKIGCHEQSVAGWITRGYIPNAHHLREMHYLGCDVMYILTGEQTTN